MYLRCYPYDSTRMECHRRALERLAHRHCLPEPAEYVDNGRRPVDGLPQLECLVRSIERDWITTLLIPGLFVFALDDGEARTAAARLRGLGCRLIELTRSGLLPAVGVPASRAFRTAQPRQPRQLVPQREAA
ncbi:hypothetical protein PUR61_17345 [Streptomyces sp. BE20]|uniref:hypothetical protein n=1 Tax=Streptomyces sp. BE20 TaxID=3002525 RepID=UPI002E78DA3E|nr:hypothetical protein [Streptomyces sp. BE20]MEE1823942.1 hypothetical protein [Streptomyces sp. BE20]